VTLSAPLGHSLDWETPQELCSAGCVHVPVASNWEVGCQCGVAVEAREIFQTSFPVDQIFGSVEFDNFVDFEYVVFLWLEVECRLERSRRVRWFE